MHGIKSDLPPSDLHFMTGRAEYFYEICILKNSSEGTKRMETKDHFGSLKKLIKIIEDSVGKSEYLFFPSPVVTYSSLASSVPQQLWGTLVISLGIVT